MAWDRHYWQMSCVCPLEIYWIVMDYCSHQRKFCSIPLCTATHFSHTSVSCMFLWKKRENQWWIISLMINKKKKENEKWKKKRYCRGSDGIVAWMCVASFKREFQVVKSVFQHTLYQRVMQDLLQLKWTVLKGNWLIFQALILDSCRPSSV